MIQDANRENRNRLPPFPRVFFIYLFVNHVKMTIKHHCKIKPILPSVCPITKNKKSKHLNNKSGYNRLSFIFNSNI